MKLTTIKIQKQKLERWKMIEGYSNYMVSSLGRVKSLGNDKNRKEKILKPRINKDGYLQVNLCKNGKVKMFLVHRLVAIAFIPNPLNKPFIDHIDTNPSNNNVKNLKWVTQKENCNNPLSVEKYSKANTGKKHPGAKKVRCIETGEVFDCIKYACEWSGSHRSNIAKQIQGKQKSAGKHPVTGEKLHWEYVVEEIELDLNIFTSNYINISI